MSTDAVVTLPQGLPTYTLGWDVLWWTTCYIRQPDGPNAGSNWHFTSEQCRFILWWYAIDHNGRWLYSRGVLRRSKGWGKALALDTPVPTPTGWTTMGDLQPGDTVFDDHGEPCIVRAVSPIWLDTDCWRVEFSDGEAVVASGDHLWTVEELTAGYNTRTVDTRTLAARCRMRADRACNYRLAMPGTLNTPEIDLPIDPYVLGAWLGDGDSMGGRLTNPDSAIADEITLAGFEIRQQARPLTYSVIGLQLQLRRTGLLGNKHIPLPYLRASEKQRLALLQGLMDTDGYVEETGTCEFCTTTPALRDGVEELLAGLGIKHTTIEGRAILDGRDCGPKWRTKFTVHDDMPVFRLDRKRRRLKSASTRRAPHRTRRVVSVEPVESRPTRCIEVDSASHLFLVGHKMVQTHNSPFVAALALAELCGPVRFEGWAVGGETRPWRIEPYAEGDPIAQPVPAAWVQLAGVSEQQTVNTMSMVLAMCAESPIVEEYGLDLGLTRIYSMTGGRLQPITASAPTAEGARPTFIAEDETQWYTDSNGGVALDRVNRRNVGKSPGGTARVLETTNAHAAGEESVAERSYEAYLAMRDGLTRAAHLLYDAREAPADTDMADEESLLAGLAAAYGDSKWVDLERIRDEIWDPSTPPEDSRRFYLDQIASSVDAWLTEPEWKGCADATKVIADGDLITLGFDGSRSRAKGVTDATALIGCRVIDGHLFEILIEEQPAGPAGRDWSVPATKVDAAVRDAFERYTVVGMYADPAKWESYLAAWEAAYHRKLKVKASQQHPIHWWMTGTRAAAIVRMFESFHGAVVDGELSHDGSYALTRHALNARRRTSRAGIQIAKEHPDSARKIDAVVAASLAWQARLDAVAAGVTAKRKARARGF